jgi:tRNA/tmRNA/rRNA uracil-C5-methylase (TrmA/RlmC/RlmD family)
MRRLFATATTVGWSRPSSSRCARRRRREGGTAGATTRDDDDDDDDDDDASAMRSFEEKVRSVTRTFDAAPKSERFKRVEAFASPKVDGHRTRASFGVAPKPPAPRRREEDAGRSASAASAASARLRLMTTTPNGGELMDVFDARRVVREESEGVRRGVDALLRSIAHVEEENGNGSASSSMRAASVLSNRAATEIVVSTTHDRDAFDEEAWRAMAMRMMAVEPAVVGVIGKRKKISPHLVVGRGDYVFEETTTTTTFSGGDREAEERRTVVFKHREGSFSNPNPDVAEQTANYLCDVARALTKDGLTPTRFVELYAGCGNHSVTLAPYFSLGAYAVEINDELVEAARENFARNDVGDRAEIVCAPAEEWVTTQRNAKANAAAATVLLVDPPRGGLDPKTLDFVSREFDIVIYVACDYKSLRRDMDDKFIERGFAIERLACFDHAPTSAKWIETVAVLIRRRMAVV